MQYLSSKAGMAVTPGEHDCAQFAAGAVAAMTGEDFSKGWKYTSYAEGVAQLRKAGHIDHVAFTASLLPEIEPVMARVGDVAVVDSEQGQALGVYQGAGIYVLHEAGLGIVSRSKALRAFKVGD